MWVTKNQIESMKLQLKPSAKPVECILDVQKTKTPFECYRIDDIVEEKALKRAIAHRHISAYTGNPYRAIALYSLIRASVDKNFTSGLWSTKHRLKAQGIDVKPNETPTVISFSDDTKLELYNADQTTDRAKVHQIRADADKNPLSAKTGGEFRGELRDTLISAASSSPEFNNIWLTKKQAASIGVFIRNSEPSVDMNIDGRSISFFNSCQTNAPQRVIAHMRNLR
ncbi:peptidase M neutral zinc metallopeptidase zinc-binding site [Perkinsela sp. CCAP 1560/4]|nr:peptidase M neutral zinc metallopeptidase zinc-binding site [Perkinsela sp. CCAP 1560/4]|eukprot:KNH07051.1 peptidase M neutral zinc metallopeptidase zinc-binding site [Perkinsela sp. CCAP 1560/4]